MSDNTVGQVELELLLNSKSFKSQLEGAVNKAVSKTSASMSGTVGKTFGKIGKLAVAAFSVKAIGGFVKSSIALGSALQEVQNVVDSTFPTMSKEIDKFASKSLKMYGLSQKQAKQYTSTLGAMAQSFGFNEKEAFDMSTKIAGLTGDVASFYNLPHDQAYNKLKSIFTGETESLKELGVVMTQSALDEYALQRGFGKTTAKMTEQEKVALRFAFVLEKLNMAAGDFSRTEGGWANQTRMLTEQWHDFKSYLGQAFIAVLTPLIKALNIVMEKLVAVSKTFSEFVNKVMHVGENEDGMAAVADSAAQAEQNIEGTTKAAQKMKKSLLGIDRLNILSSNKAGAGTGAAIAGVGSTKPDTQNATAAEKTATSYGKATKMIKYFKDEALQWLKLVADGPVQYYTNLGEDVFNLITKPFIDNKDEIKRQLDLTLDDLQFFNDEFQIVYGDVWDKVNEVYEEHGKPLINTLSEGASELLETALSKYEEYIRPTISQIKEEIGPLWKETLKPAFDQAMDTIGLLADKLGVLWNTILKPLYKWMIEIFVLKLKIQLEVLWIAVKNGIEFISGIISAFSRSLTGLINFIEGVFTGNWKQAWEGVRDIFEGVFDGIEATVKTILNTVIDLINKGIGAVNKMKVPDWVPGIGGTSPNIGKIPRLAKGGYVKANTPQLAMIGDNRHEGEIVAPESKIAEAVSEGLMPIYAMMKQLITELSKNNKGGNISIPIYLDGSLLDEYLVDAENRRYLRSGGFE